MRIVIKIGTSTLAHPTGHLNIRLVEQLCKVISDIKNGGHEVILVSSGAIGMGVGKLGLGCEMGISTQKLHARGPMGLRELTSYKYIITGNGHIR